MFFLSGRGSKLRNVLSGLILERSSMRVVPWLDQEFFGEIGGDFPVPLCPRVGWLGRALPHRVSRA